MSSNAGCGPDVLGDVAAAWLEDAVYPGPVRTHRMTGGHQREECVWER